MAFHAVALLLAPIAQASPLHFVLEQVANSSQTAPSGNPYEATGAFNEPGASSTGVIVFRSLDANFDRFIKTGTPGARTTVASHGDPVPASSALPSNSTYHTFDNNVQIAGDTVLFKASPNVAGGGVDVGQQLLIEDVSGIQAVVLQEGATVSPATGLPISGIVDSEGYGLGIGHSVHEIDESNASEDGSITVFQGGVLSLVQTESDTPPVGTTYSFLQDPYADRNGPGIIFEATIDDNAIQALVLTEDDGATLSVLAQNSDPVAGASSLLESINEGVIDGGNIAAEAVFGSNNGVLYIPAGGPLQAVAEVGVTVIPVGGVLTDRRDVALSGEAVFIEGAIDGAQALLAWNNGMLTEIVRAGDVLDGITVDEVEFNRGGLLATSLASRSPAAWAAPPRAPSTAARSPWCPNRHRSCC